MNYWSQGSYRSCQEIPICIWQLCLRLSSVLQFSYHYKIVKISTLQKKGRGLQKLLPFLFEKKSSSRSRKASVMIVAAAFLSSRLTLQHKRECLVVSKFESSSKVKNCEFWVVVLDEKMSKNVTSQDVLKLKLNDGCQTPSLNGWWLWSSQKKYQNFSFPDVVVGGFGPPIIKEAVRIWASKISNPKINSTINSGTTKSNNKTVSVTIFCRDINGGPLRMTNDHQLHCITKYLGGLPWK